MKSLVKGLVVAAAAAVAPLSGAIAADYIEPPVIETPPPPVHVATGGWYIRGDIGYAWNKFRGSTYHIDTCVVCGVAGAESVGTLDGKLKGSFTAGVGVGYQVNSYFRTDVTLDRTFKSEFRGTTTGTCTFFGGGTGACSSTDVTSFSALALMANAYVELGKFGKIKPYGGVGIGGARVTWAELQNTIPAGWVESGTTVHAGRSEWRFAWALMAGVSVAATKNVDLDFGYRFRRIEGGQMFGWRNGAGPGFDKGIDQHELRAGLRYKFGGGYAHASDCCMEVAKY